MNKKTLIVVGLAQAIAACGGGGGGGGGSTTPSSVSGSATKGVIANAVVEAYEIAKDGSLSTSPVGSDTTTANGDYQITLTSAYQGGPLRIVIKGGKGATMTCDIPAGCGGVGFGQPKLLSDSFKLAAVTPAPSNRSISVHVNTLTDLADKIAAKDGYGSANSISGANDRIRQAFSLTTDITSVKPVDISKPSSINAGDLNARKVALLSAALLSAVAKGDEANFETRLASFSQKVGSDGGLVRNDDDTGTIVSVQDILAETEAVAKTVNNPGLDTAIAQARYAEADISKSPSSNSPEVITPTDTSKKPNIEKAKALAGDLRMLANAANGEIKTGLNTFNSYVQGAFGSSTSLVDAVANKDLLDLAEHSNIVMLAIAEAAGAYTNDTQNGVTPKGTYTANKGSPDEVSVTVKSGSNQKNPEFSASKSFDNGTQVNLVANATLMDVKNAESASGENRTQHLTGNAALSASGVITNKALKLTISNAAISVDGLDYDYSYKETNTPSAGYSRETSSTETAKFGLFKAALDIKIGQIATDHPVVFDGSMAVEVNNLDYQSKTNFSCCMSYSQSLDEKSRAQSAKVGIRGRFSRDSELLEAAFNVAASAPADLKYSTMFSVSYPNGSHFESGANETENNFLGLESSVVFKAKLAGAGDTLVSLNAKRTGLKDFTATAQLGYGKKALTVGADSSTKKISITNQDNVVINTQVPLDGRKWDGIIRVGEEKVGQIDTARDGLIIIRYSDGSFESIM